MSISAEALEKQDHEHFHTASDAPGDDFAGRDPTKLYGVHGTTAADDEDIRITKKTFAVLFAISLLALAASLAVTGPPGLVSYIVRDLGDSADASWISAGSTCLQATIASPIAYMTDLYGRRWLLMFTTCLAIIGTFLTGSSTSMMQVIAGQCLTGSCLATKPLCYAIGSEVLPRRYRAAVQFWIGELALIGQLVGAIGGPAMVNRNAVDGWRWFFYMEGGFFILSLVTLFIFYRPPPRITLESTYTLRQKVANLDYIGWLLQSSGFLLFLVGISWGGSGAYQWGSAHVLAPMCIGFTLLLCFAIYEWKGRDDGLAPHALFQDRNYPLSLLAIFIEGMVLFSWLTEYSAEATSVWADSAIGLGLRIMPFPIAGMIVTPIWAVIATRYKNVKWLNALGFVLFVVSAVMMATASIKGSTQSVAADTVAGIAYSLPLALLITSAQLAIPPKYIGVGSALLATCRAIGSSISVSIFKSILTPQLTARLSPYVTAAATTGGLSAANAKAAVAATAAGVSKDFSPAALLAIPGMTSSLVEILFDASRQAYVDAYRYVWYIVVGLSALGAVLLLFFKPAKDQMNAQIDAPAEDVHAHIAMQRKEAAA